MSAGVRRGSKAYWCDARHAEAGYNPEETFTSGPNV